jgi:CheY-like chemotaxis protein
MQRLRLFHWNSEEGAGVAAALRQAGFAVDFDPQPFPRLMRELRTAPPDAVVIDLSRLPSHGREVATALRGNKQTRQIPILFLDGAPEKVAVVREKLPDAAYCERARLVAAVKKCIKERLANPVVPMQMMERYAGRTTAQKLGIAAGSRVAVVDGPRDYAHVIGALPEGVEFDEEGGSGCAVTIWFIEDPDVYLASLPKMRRIAGKSKLWVAWPKKAARKDSLMNENLIREIALENGLVDYKVCSVNETWSGLCLAVKKAT